MKLEHPQIDNRLQLFPHSKGWAIFDEKTYRFSDIIEDFSQALQIAKKIAVTNEATLLVRDQEGEVILKTVYG